MEVNYLHMDELDYELRIRGAIVQANVDTKRSILRGHLQCEKMEGQVSHPAVVIDIQEESKICKDKLCILEGMINQFKSDCRHPDYKRIRTKLLHLKNRINNLSNKNQDEANLKSELVAKCMLLYDKLEQAVSQNINSEKVNLLDLVDVNDNSPIAHSLRDDNARQNNEVTNNNVPGSLNNIESVISPTNYNIVTDTRDEPVINLNSSENNQPPLQGLRNNDRQHIQFMPAIFPDEIERNSYLNQNVHVTSSMYCEGNAEPPNSNNPNNVGLYSHVNQRGNIPVFGQFSSNRAHENNSVPIRQHMGATNHNSVMNRVNFQIPSLSKLNLKFSGKNEGLHSFLERIEEFCLTHHIDKSQILTFAHEMFEGDVLQWYRANRVMFSTWDDLVEALKRVFLPCDFEVDLWNEIMGRTQGQGEKVLIYIAKMQNMFKRLSNPPHESFQLQVILRNLQPYFQYHLSLNHPTSLWELKNICKLIEDAKLRTERFKEPPACTSQTLEPDLAYYRSSSTRNRLQLNEICQTPYPMLGYQEPTKVEHVRVALENTVPSIENGTSTPNSLAISRNQVNTITCYNCSIQGHKHSACRKPKTVFCYGCGQKNIIKPKCTKCNPKNVVTAVSQSAGAAQDN